MDIRSFFGKKSDSQDDEAEESKTKLKRKTRTNTKKEEKDRQKGKESKDEDGTKKTRKKQNKEEENEPKPIVKKKRILKKVVVSDSSSSESPIVLDEPVPEKGSGKLGEKTSPKDKNETKSVRSWMMEELKMKDPEKLEELDKDNSSAENMQTDIQNWCNNEKKLVDMSTCVNKGKAVKVDMGSYLDSVSGPKMGKKSKTSKDGDSQSVTKKGEKTLKEELDEINQSEKSPKRDTDSNISSPRVVVKRLQYHQRKSKKEEGDSPRKLVKDYNLPRRLSSTVELVKPEPMESLVWSSQSSVHTSPTESPEKRSVISEDSPLFKKIKIIKISPKRVPDLEEDIQDPVRGKKFVFTGELSINRDEATYRVRKMGGIVVSGVSGQTDYLVYGEKLEDGRPFETGTKYKKAKELNKTKGLNIQIINENEFMALIEESKSARESLTTESELGRESKEETISPISVMTSKTEDLFGDPDEVIGEREELMLFEKYRPKKLSELVGNPRLIERLKEWLQNFDYMTGPKRFKGEVFKGALLSGPPGIGKTTCARLVAESFGYDVMEFNASDQRSKNAIERITPLATGTVTINTYQKGEQMDLKKTLLVLDEIDGMSSGDRGGIQAIIKLLQQSKCPIILICNDRYSQKINTLASKCLDLRFTPPAIEMFMSRVTEICTLEGIPASENLILDLYHKSSGDMRFTLNYLQFFTPTSIAGQEAYINKKDASYSQNIFDNCNKAFNLKGETCQDKINRSTELFFTDYNIMSLMLQENYLKYLNNIGVAAKVAMSYVQGDLVNTVLQKSQVYSLLPDLATLTAVIPSLEVNKAKGIQKERLAFPQWLGKYSTTTKNRRILSEISMNLSDKTIVYGAKLLMDGYLELVYQKAMKYLLKEKVDECAEFISEMGMTRELVVEGIANIRFKNQENLFNKISTRTKTQLTKKMASQLVKVVTNKKSQFKSMDWKEEGESDQEAKSEEEDNDPLLKKVNTSKKKTKQKKK